MSGTAKSRAGTRAHYGKGHSKKMAKAGNVKHFQTPQPPKKVEQKEVEYFGKWLYDRGDKISRKVLGHIISDGEFFHGKDVDNHDLYYLDINRANVGECCKQAVIKGTDFFTANYEGIQLSPEIVEEMAKVIYMNLSIIMFG